MAAKKRETRKLMATDAWVTMDGGFAARQCVVKDISSAGARISLADATQLTGRLRLAFGRDARTGRACQLIWQRGKSAGLRFV